MPSQSLTTLLAKYDPNQPRVPAGNSDGEQWTNGGGSVASQADEERDQELLPENAVPVASRVDLSNGLTGIERIDNTTLSLARTLANVGEVASFTPQATPKLYGMLIHKVFANAVRVHSIPGIGYFDVEQTFGDVPDAPYGARGSIRTDVVLRNEVGDIIAIYDVKTGNARLTPARVRELRLKTRTGFSVPIIELHIDRSVSIKRLAVTSCRLFAHGIG